MQIDRDYRDFQFYSVCVHRDVVFIVYDHQGPTGMIYHVPKWTRLPLTDFQQLGEYVQSQAWQWDELGQSVASARPLNLVPTFLYEEVNAATWNEFARSISLCSVFYHKTRLIVCPNCHRFERCNCFFHPIAELKRETRGPFTAEQIGEEICTGAKLAWQADQETDGHVIPAPREQSGPHRWN
jgi:hypothetical protein